MRTPPGLLNCPPAVFLSQFSWCGDASDTGLLQRGVLWEYLERLSTQDTVPGFVMEVPFDTPAEPAGNTSPEKIPEKKKKEKHSKRRRSDEPDE